MRAKRSWNVLTLLEWTTQYFQKRGIENPRLDAEILLAHTLKFKRIDLYLNYDRPLIEDELSSFREVVRKRGKREPLQYITGIQGFWSLDFKVGSGVLIPRPETELLVEETLKVVRGIGHGARGQKKSEIRNPKSEIRILDLCTGCGCVAIAVAKELANSWIYAVDSSEVALKVACFNAARHDVKERTTFLSGNLFQPLKGVDLEGKFDLIVSNPPYVKRGDLKGLEPEIKDYEPLSALDGGEDGLDVIRSIVREAPDYLKGSGWLILEIAFDQAEAVETFIGERGIYASVSVIKDLSGSDRVVKARVESGE